MPSLPLSISPPFQAPWLFLSVIAVLVAFFDVPLMFATLSSLVSFPPAAPLCLCSCSLTAVCLILLAPAGSATWLSLKSAKQSYRLRLIKLQVGVKLIPLLESQYT